MDQPRWLNDAEMRAWIGYRRMRLLLDAQIARDLASDSGLSEPDYDVLSYLSSCEDYRGRLNTLATRMLWSTSRLSHHITRMQHRGLVQREECVDDGRGTEIVLTEAGLQALTDAAPHHVASVRQNFIDMLTPRQLHTFAAIAEKITEHLRRS